MVAALVIGTNAEVFVDGTFGEASLSIQVCLDVGHACWCCGTTQVFMYDTGSGWLPSDIYTWPDMIQALAAFHGRVIALPRKPSHAAIVSL